MLDLIRIKKRLPIVLFVFLVSILLFIFSYLVAASEYFPSIGRSDVFLILEPVILFAFIRIAKNPQGKFLLFTKLYENSATSFLKTFFIELLLSGCSFVLCNISFLLGILLVYKKYLFVSIYVFLYFVCYILFSYLFYYFIICKCKISYSSITTHYGTKRKKILSNRFSSLFLSNMKIFSKIFLSNVSLMVYFSLLLILFLSLIRYIAGTTESEIIRLCLFGSFCIVYMIGIIIQEYLKHINFTLLKLYTSGYMKFKISILIQLSLIFIVFLFWLLFILHYSFLVFLFSFLSLIFFSLLVIDTTIIYGYGFTTGIITFGLLLITYFSCINYWYLSISFLSGITLLLNKLSLKKYITKNWREA